MNEVADFTPDAEDDALLNLDRAHKAFEKVSADLVEAMSAARAKVIREHNPVFYLSQSILYEAMAKATKAGFTDEDMFKTMNCGSH